MSAKQLAATLTEAGLELPAPIQAFLEGRLFHWRSTHELVSASGRGRGGSQPSNTTS